MGVCRGCSGAGVQRGRGCPLPLEQGSSSSTAQATGEPLLQGDCKMALAGAEEQHAKMH